MFTGIVETTGKVVSIERDRTNIHITIETPIAKELKIDQSMCHDGVCLTVVSVDYDKSQYVVTAIQETLDKTNLGHWQTGYEVNLERSMRMEARFDGHIVQGHVDQTAVCNRVEEMDGSWKFWFDYDASKKNITVEKGSISVNGVSLTVVDSQPGQFSVAIIPFTYQVTNFHNFKKGTVINIEFDVFGKYVAKLLQQYLDQKGL
ncbi:MAG TPA: riboflavin synthase [Bacteroidales bacterium]|nr:riboflavin synthase [Bacteroidales bacterium]HNZ41710.1 riboflavin synthase [Bacteroidales bacterium]HOH83709.1 riboflavin synthase [Bacteroidales bacterium]HPB25562.1 riboflavin synthase [Bacteroidales bacterium]HPI30413.1 riboflavin synthase [Bacteroidales bacterium]